MLFCYLPEGFILDLIDSFTEIIKLNPRGVKTFNPESIINLTEFCITILRTDTKAISNPHVKAKALELIAIFIYADQKKEMMGDFNNSSVIKKFFMDTLVNFYVDIEFAGTGMFYTKF